MNALRVVIADDEPLARLRLRRLLGGIQGVEVVAECASGIEVMQLLPDCPCDLLLLDIQMPGADGFQALEHGVARPRAVVFVTAYAEHAVRAFDVQAVDYLLKPVSAERLQQALERVQRALAGDVPLAAPVAIPRRLALPELQRWLQEQDTFIRSGRSAAQVFVCSPILLWDLPLNLSIEVR